MSGGGREGERDGREALLRLLQAFFFSSALPLKTRRAHHPLHLCLQSENRALFRSSPVNPGSSQVRADGFRNDKIALICPILTLGLLLPMTHTVFEMSSFFVRTSKFRTRSREKLN